MSKKALNRPFAKLAKRLERQRAQRQLEQAPLPQNERAQQEAEHSFATLAAQPHSITPLSDGPKRVTPPRFDAVPSATPPAQVPAPASEHYDLIVQGSYLEGRRSDVDPAELTSLAQSHPRSVVDLHRLGAEQARSRLQRTIIGRHARGERDVLVIVGKGLHSEEGHAVLRGEVALWLSEGRMAPYVRAFVSARREHGGHGAVYVRLRP